MSFALSAAVTGLKAHQSMLDIAGNNLANVNTTGFKSQSVTFSDLLSQTIKQASGPSGSLGGTNPQQKGSGVGVATISRNMSQGNILSTGQDLDCAIDGAGYFVLSNGQQVVYSRIGSFSVDSDNTLVDPATGYKVQRMSMPTDQFQVAGSTSIHIPYDAAMPANATSEVIMNGNLRSSAEATDATTNTLTSDLTFTTTAGTPASTNTPMTSISNSVLDLDDGETVAFTVTATNPDGTAAAAAITYTQGAGDTMADFLAQVDAAFTGVSSGLDANGNLVLVDDTAGYSQTSVSNWAFNAGGSSATVTCVDPTFFTTTTAGGNDSKSFNITVYDSYGEPHILSGTFVKTDTANTWDMAITEVEGEQARTFGDGYDRVIEGIQFNTNGSYNGLANPATSTSIVINFGTTTQNISFDLGTVGEFTGLTQFASEQSSAAALRQDGYTAGQLSSVSIDQGGTVIGTFSNGVKQEISTLRVAVFQNPQGLEAVGNGYFLPSSNSGLAVDTTANNNGAGAIKGKSLEKSNVDTATEFVNLMQAQNGYQANARTIRVANDVLRELTNIIR